MHARILEPVPTRLEFVLCLNTILGFQYRASTPPRTHNFEIRLKDESRVRTRLHRYLNKTLIIITIKIIRAILTTKLFCYSNTLLRSCSTLVREPLYLQRVSPITFAKGLNILSLFEWHIQTDVKMTSMHVQCWSEFFTYLFG